LEGNGWAINGRVRINIPLGNSMTRLATLPPNARSSLHDPFEDLAAKRQSILYTTFAIVVVLALLYFFILKPKFIDDPREAARKEWQAQYDSLRKSSEKPPVVAPVPTPPSAPAPVAAPAPVPAPVPPGPIPPK
ncbi:MAG TPA: hypothetical protein VL860_04540, partial [Planctomycetota bacterium]|nr:hypothetical protein [Planctomycetota bacterium]